jgi:hypothetical protein
VPGGGDTLPSDARALMLTYSTRQKARRLGFALNALALQARRGYHRAVIAVAAKNARIIWALLAKARDFALPV